MSEQFFDMALADEGETDYKDVLEPEQSPCVPIAKAIMKRNTYITYRDTEEILAYDAKTGTYKQYGPTYIKEITAKIMKNGYRSGMANEVINYIKTQTYVDRSDIGTPPNKITLQNGVLDIKTRTLSRHNKEDQSLTCIPVFYDPKATCPNFQNFLNQSMSVQEAYNLQEYWGYFLHRDYIFRKALLICGPPGTGKTTLLRVMNAFLGQENVSAIPLQNLDERFTVAELYGKMANICDELSPAAMKNTSQFKALTGHSQVKGEYKFKGHFYFTNEAKLVFATNQTPRAFFPLDQAFFERWQIIKMANKVSSTKVDPYLFQKLTTQSELSGILNWALDGLDRLHARGLFSDLPSFLDVQAEFGCADSVGMFIRDKVSFDPASTIAKKTLNAAYLTYCSGKILPAVSYGELCQRIGQLNGVSKPRTGSKTRIQSFGGIRV